MGREGWRDGVGEERREGGGGDRGGTEGGDGEGRGRGRG